MSAAKDPLVPLLVLLSFTTGVVDAVSILGLEKVFTANMTGNVVFLAFALAGEASFHWPYYVTALGFFAAGAVAAGLIGRRSQEHGRRRWLLIVASLEAALLAAAAVCALVVSDEPKTPLWALFSMIALTAAAMGGRNATVRQLKVADLTTTVLTLTVAGLAADSNLAGGRNPNFGRRVAAIGAILAGAVAGALMLRLGGVALPLMVAAVAVLGATFALVRDEAVEAVA